MATTALFVEILVIGALAESWLVLLALALTSRSQLYSLADTLVNLKDFGTILAFALLAVTYAFGWVVNYACESSLKRLFEPALRDPEFGGDPNKYEDARLTFLQLGSPELVREISFDRHIIRIARSNIVNFAALSVVLLFYWHRIETAPLVFVVVSCILIAVISFYQWRSRCRAHYKRVARVAVMLNSPGALPNSA